MEVKLQLKRDFRRDLEIYKEIVQAQTIKTVQTKSKRVEEDFDSEPGFYTGDSYRFLTENGVDIFITSCERFETIK